MQILRIKLAPVETRIAVVMELASRGLSTSDRRQVLLAIQRYLIGQRSEALSALPSLLDSVVKLADSYENWITALDIFKQVMDGLRREDIAQQVQDHLECLVKCQLPSGGHAVFSPDLFVRVARRMEHKQDMDGIVKLTSLGLFFFPFHRTLRELRADCAIIQGDFGMARGDFDRLLEQFPEEIGYLFDRAEASYKLEDYEEALADLEDYLHLQPNDQAALARASDCQFQLGRSAEAVAGFSKVIELDPNVADHYVRRGRAYEHLEFQEDAAKDAAKALEIDPNNLEARQLRQSLAMRRQAFGSEDDIYTSFARGEDEAVLGEAKVPDIHFSDIGGLLAVKEQIRENIEYPFKHPEISKRYGKVAGGGLLFFGPPGCGKTMLAKAAAGECDVSFINVNLATVLDKWVGNSEKAISMIFSAARKKAPSIIFLDEVDAIGGQRSSMQSGWEKKLISQLLIELDGLTSNNERVMVLGATNAPWDVDYALRRPGRLGRLVFVPPPASPERAEIFRLYLSKRPANLDDIDFDDLGRRSERYSADAIRQVVENAASIPWRKAIETGEEQPITMLDLNAALLQTPPDLAEWEKMVSRYEDFAKQSLKQPSIGFRRAKPQHA